ncbi:MAG: tyrosine-type recombinase/integrase [Bryobacteraceae bacterium]
MEVLYEQFIRERQYLLNVSEKTVQAYRWAWRAFESALKGKPTVSKADVLLRVAELREQGLSPVTINTYLRSVNAFSNWMVKENHSETQTRIPRLKEERKVLQTFSDAHIAKLISFRGRSFGEQRTHLLACMILDTGVRIDEALSIERSTDINLDELLLKVKNGKGRKERRIPISMQMRKLLFRFMHQWKPAYGDMLLYAGQGGKVVQRNALRDFKALCKHLSITGVRCSFHTMRHSFAVAYLRNGGDVFRLQRILDHNKLDMTRRYVNLQTEDLQAVHQRLSLLAQAGRI